MANRILVHRDCHLIYTFQSHFPCYSEEKYLLFLILERYIDKIQRPGGSKAPEIKTIERPTKGVDLGKFDELLKELPAKGSAATFINDKLHGIFPEEFLKHLKQRSDIKLVDAAGFFERVISVKTPPEQVRLRHKG